MGVPDGAAGTESHGLGRSGPRGSQEPAALPPGRPVTKADFLQLVRRPQVCGDGSRVPAVWAAALSAGAPPAERGPFLSGALRSVPGAAFQACAVLGTRLEDLTVLVTFGSFSPRSR